MPIAFNALRICFSVTSVNVVVAPMPVAAMKCSVPATIFLSCAMAPTISLRREIHDGRQRPELRDQRGDALLDVRGRDAALHAERERGEHAVGDRLAVAEAAEPRDRFEGVADGVAEVQHAAQPGLALVGGDDLAP